MQSQFYGAFFWEKLSRGTNLVILVTFNVMRLFHITKLKGPKIGKTMTENLWPQPTLTVGPDQNYDNDEP